jgi:hypothetical protein
VRVKGRPSFPFLSTSAKTASTLSCGTLTSCAPGYLEKYSARRLPAGRLGELQIVAARTPILTVMLLQATGCHSDVPTPKHLNTKLCACCGCSAVASHRS